VEAKERLGTIFRDEEVEVSRNEGNKRKRSGKRIKHTFWSFCHSLEYEYSSDLSILRNHLG
jgi:hypothetical protein